MKNRILFILKARDGNWGYGSKESGLSNSVRFVVDMLNANGIEAKAVEVRDNNCIDREVAAYCPTHVIVEAFWVVPEKFDVLKPLHPDVQWIVRDHSETPFLANEGNAFGWTVDYLKRGIEVMCNAPRAVSDMAVVAMGCGLDPSGVSYGPNVYPVPRLCDITPHERRSDVVNIGCFGAVRPLKNHMTQAVAAMAFAESIGAQLRFHVNATRVEGQGSPVLKNLRELFARSAHELVEHGWMPHSGFLDVLGGIDILMQVSFTETFNIVAADAMASSVPVLVSSEIPWIGHYAHRDPTDAADMAQGLYEIWNEGWCEQQKRLLKQRRDMEVFCARSTATWRRRFGSFWQMNSQFVCLQDA
ncbi:glycosyltransferase family protein [Acetobacter conturbans]|uniref:Glycosyltransferase family 1 protein n=1 Tax=Acetobacter conturbans TaxID=1737472 RepID=A0ABX0K3S9_9PROT|nr:glycosyltransferase family 1 protein [Acetobacter conturbans]NHN88983.1 glycosyltransferase family 1 protein [Acetobacter conturbans]